MSLGAKTTVHAVGYVFIALTWLPLFFLIFLIATYSPALEERRTGCTDSQGLYLFLCEKYQPSTVQYLHPLYLFFFPTREEELREVNNAIVHIGQEGFRGAGVEEGGKRKIAFLLGGSTAFGHFATSDDKTITGYLNAFQEEYHFVNAGVPSWNTTQELHRLVDQLLRYHPALVVTLDGFNDLAVAITYYRQGAPYPPSTPESFRELDLLFHDVRAVAPFVENNSPEFEEQMRDLFRKFRKLHGLQWETRSVGDGSALARGVADVYTQNVETMQKISEAYGSRFLALFQPVQSEHMNTDFVIRDESQRSEVYVLFRRAVIKMANEKGISLTDFSDIFDRSMASVPVFDGSLTDLKPEEHIFVDNVHLTDRGNAIVAKEIIALLREKEWLEPSLLKTEDMENLATFDSRDSVPTQTILLR